MFRNAFNPLAYLCFYIVNLVYSQEPKCPRTYMEERLLEKMVEMDVKLKSISEILEKMDFQKKDHERISRSREDSQGHMDVPSCKTQLPTCVLESTMLLKISSLEIDGWQLIFRAASGNGQNVFDAWTKGESTDEDKPSLMERSYARHYRSKAVADWSKLGIKYVKFALYERNSEVASVIFNGIGSSMNDWFGKSRVIFSTWSDLTMSHDFNYFSIAGYSSGSLDRRFHISKKYGGCDKDQGHVAVIDTKANGGCPWDQHPVYPQFLYSKVNAADFWNRRQFGRADYMAIFIRT